MYLQDVKTRKWSIQGTIIERRAHDRSYYVQVDRTGRIYLRNRIFLKPSKHPTAATTCVDYMKVADDCGFDATVGAFGDSLGGRINLCSEVSVPSKNGILRFRTSGMLKTAGLVRRIGTLCTPRTRVTFDTKVKVYKYEYVSGENEA